MNKFMLSLIVIVAITTSNNISAQEVDKKPEITTSKTIKSSDEEITEVLYKGITYYIFNSTWHTKMKNRYVLRNAPKGAKIGFKPIGGEYVTMHGKKYYRCKGIFYKEYKDSVFEVVRI